MRKTLPLLTKTTCSVCNRRMTPEEVAYYERRCERCERKWHERVQRWLRGAEDKDLEALYSWPPGAGGNDE